MKRFYLFIIVCSLGLVSCKKKACYVCVTEPYPPSQSSATNAVTETVCDMTKRDIKDYEDLRTNQNSICKCTKKED